MSSRVLLTFDFDAISLWLARGLTSPGPVSRGEFGVVGTKRILALLEKHSITTTFFIPGHTAETYPDSVRQISDHGHEIALHGYCHEPVSTLSKQEERDVVFKSKDVIETITGQVARGYRTPSADYTENTIDILLEAELEYDSSLMGDDYSPYYARTGDSPLADSPYQFGQNTSMVELPVSWTLDDYPYMEWVKTKDTIAPGLRRPADMFANFFDDITYMIEHEPGGTATIMFHPQVIGRGHRMMALEEFILRLRNIDVEFGTCINAARDFRQIAANQSESLRTGSNTQ